MQEIDARFRSMLGEIGTATPVAALEAYILRLDQPQLVAGNAVASRSLTEARKADAAILKKSLGALKKPPEPLSPFPARTGAPETAAYLGTFAPISMGVFVIECLLPACLFFLNWGWMKMRVEMDGDDLPPGDGDGNGGGERDLLAEASDGVVRSIREPARVHLIRNQQSKG